MTTEKKTSKFGSLWMKLPQPVRYGILSVSAGVIQAISFALLFELFFRKGYGLSVPGGGDAAACEGANTDG